MKKVFLSLAILVMAICANAQKNQYFWYQSNLMLGTEIAQIDSVTFGDDESTDTLHILLPRTIIKTVRETIEVTIHDTMYLNKYVCLPEGALPGEFSVSPTKKVRFSKGNLQYNRVSNTWIFAENQYDFLGKNNFINPQLMTRTAPTNYSLYYWQGTELNDVIDLFAWSSDKDLSRKWGIESSSDDASKFNGNFVDWGENFSDSWYTMSKDEWDYIISEREHASDLIAIGTINGINGCIILPDGWKLPKNMTFNSGTANINDSIYYSTINNYSIEEWSIMENAGAVFLPSNGDRSLPHMYTNWSNIKGAYWSATIIDNKSAYVFSIRPDFAQVSNSWFYVGRSVRLVQDVK